MSLAFKALTVLDIFTLLFITGKLNVKMMTASIVFNPVSNSSQNKGWIQIRETENFEKKTEGFEF